MGNNNLKTQHENEANNKRIGATLLLEEIDSNSDYVKTFLGFHEGFNKKVLVKELQHTFWNKDDIKNKLLLFKSLKNDSLPEVYEIFDEYNKIYIIMEYKSTITIRNLVNVQKQSDEEIINIMIQICGILSYLLNKEIVHNYLSEDNVFVDISRNVFITDYVVPKNNKEIVNLEKNDFHSIRKECIKDDIESLGKILCFLCEGKEIINNIEEFSSSTSTEFVTIISRALNFDGTIRYVSINEFENNLKDYLQVILKEKNKEEVIIEEEQPYEMDDENEHDSPIMPIYKKKMTKTSKLLEGVLLIGIIFIIVTLIGKAGYLKQRNLPIVSSIKGMKSNNDDYHLENADPVEDDNNEQDAETNNAQSNDLQNNNNGKDSEKVKLINPNASSGSIFNGTVNITVTDYSIDEDKLLLKLHVQNNYKDKITISNDKLHIMNENREMFLVNKDLMEKRQPDDKTVDIMDEKDFTFYFYYKPSENLTLCIEEVLSNIKEDRNKSLELKIK